MSRCCRSRKPVPLTCASLTVPFLVLIAGSGYITYEIIRIQEKLGSDGRMAPCRVHSLEAEEHNAKFRPIVNVVFDGAPADLNPHRATFKIDGDMMLLPTREAALSHMGASIKDGVMSYAGFVVGSAPPTLWKGESIACYAYHKDGVPTNPVEKVVLTRKSAPVKNDETILISASVVTGLTLLYLIWIFANHAWRTALGREYGVIRVMAVGMNYTDCRTDGIGVLTGITDSDNFIGMCEEAGIDDITYLTDQNYLFNAARGTAPTKECVLATIADVGARCSGEDMFIFFYAGHGDNVEDLDGDEDDGKDEAFVLMDAFGNGNEDTYLVDDEFSDALVDSFPPGCRILIVTDCCHSGTIADLDNERKYGDRPVVHIAGTQDHQEAADTGTGGAATTAMIETIRELEMGKGAGKYTIKQVFQNMQKWLITRGYTASARVDPDLQNITLNWTAAADPGKMPWPITKGGYIIDSEHTNIDGMQQPLNRV